VTRDLLHADEVRNVVRSAYGALSGGTRAVAAKLYSPEEIDAVPAVAVDWALGVANHLRYAEIQPGETILDLGCGAGIDTVLAARRTGPEGRVFALDFLPQMLERTAAAAAEAGLHNVETVEGEIDAIPLPAETVDHVVSNGVVNLAPRKARVLAECARVLRPGGKLTLADLTVDDEELPPEILTNPATWAG
jgi:arsenite methyltransferase